MDGLGIRLNKQLALWLGVSRREADDLIAAGRVKVDGKIAVLGERIRDLQAIELDSKPVSQNNKIILIALNKPVGVVCSRRSQGGDKTVYDLLPPHLQSLKTVGRLDKDSSGLILMTNDGDFTYRMTHPKFNKPKRYEVKLDKDLEPLHQQMINDHGINLIDGNSQLTLSRLNDTDRRNFEVQMHEGRNRQIRRTFESLGYHIESLHRTNFGEYALGDIASGCYETL